MPVVQRVALAYNNVYVVDTGGGRVMVDTGPDYLGAFEALDRALEGRSPDVVLATHGHVDHAGLGARWQARGVPVSLGAADHELAAGPSAAYLREVALLEAYLDGAGAPAEIAAEALAGLERRKAWARAIATHGAYQPSGRGGRWPTALRYDAFEPSTIGEQSGRLGPLQAVACPGHTPGNVVLVEPGEGWLFSGDQLLPEMTPTPALQRAPGREEAWRFRSLPAFVASLHTIGGRAFTRCYPGHGEPFDDVAGAIAANLAAIEARNEKTWQELRDGGPATVAALSEQLYPRALRRRFWQIISTVQGHLDLLEDDGRVRLDGGRYTALEP